MKYSKVLFFTLKIEHYTSTNLKSLKKIHAKSKNQTNNKQNLFGGILIGGILSRKHKKTYK